jgi:hypothetical protein
MASSGNTWQKKLMNKQRLHVLKVKGVKARFAIEPDTQLEPSDDHRSFRRAPRSFGSKKS